MQYNREELGVVQLFHTFLQSRGIGERIFANKDLCYFSKELNRKYLEKKISLVIYFDVEKFGMFLMPFEKPQEGQSVRARQKIAHLLNIAKGTTDPRVEFISQVQTQILIKFHLQNLDQASTSKSQPNINLSIKLKPQNLDQT